MMSWAIHGKASPDTVRLLRLLYLGHFFFLNSSSYYIVGSIKNILKGRWYMLLHVGL